MRKNRKKVFKSAKRRLKISDLKKILGLVLFLALGVISAGNISRSFPFSLFSQFSTFALTSQISDSHFKTKGSAAYKPAAPKNDGEIIKIFRHFLD